MLPNAPRLAHLQGTLLLLDTVCNLTDREEGRTYNSGLAAMLANEYILIFFAIISYISG